MQKLFKNVLFLSIVSGLFCNQVQAYNLSPISFANFYHIAEEGNLQGLKDVQRRGLNLNATNQNGDTAVCVAIKPLSAPERNHIRLVWKIFRNTHIKHF